jgi:ribosomal protein L16 Arg81 hydroxylase
VATSAAEIPYLEASLTPGDCLYLPRGWLHSAVADDRTSVHVTIGIHPLTAADVVSALLTELITTDPTLRRSLPLGSIGADTGRTDSIEAIRQQLIEALADVATEPVAQRLIRQFEQSHRPEPVEPLQQLDATRDLTAQTVVRLRSGLRATLSEVGERRRLTAGGRYIEVPANCFDALRVLAAGTPVTAQALPGIEADTALALVRRAMHEGIVVVA